MTNLTIESAVEQVHDISIHIVWQSLLPKYKEALVEFWLKNHAINDPQEAMRRTSEVVCLGIDADDNIAAVTTVYVSQLNNQAVNYYFYRMFIRPDCRLPGLARRLLGYTYARLNDQFYAEQMAEGLNTSHIDALGQKSNIPNGVVFITENLKLKQKAVNRVLIKQGFKLLGLMGRNTAEEKQVWKQDFSMPTPH